jgi:hypothetical protein
LPFFLGVPDMPKTFIIVTQIEADHFMFKFRFLSLSTKKW